MTLENRQAHVAAELERGRQSLRAAEELLRLGLFSDAVSRAYYAALHFTAALLLTRGLEARSHTGLGALFGQHFIVSGLFEPAFAKDLSRLEQFRGEADYNRFFVFTREGAREEVEVAVRFCAAAEDWLRREGFLPAS